MMLLLFCVCMVDVFVPVFSEIENSATKKYMKISILNVFDFEGGTQYT